MTSPTKSARTSRTSTTRFPIRSTRWTRCRMCGESATETRRWATARAFRTDAATSTPISRSIAPGAAGEPFSTPSMSAAGTASTSTTRLRRQTSVKAATPRRASRLSTRTAKVRLLGSRCLPRDPSHRRWAFRPKTDALGSSPGFSPGCRSRRGQARVLEAAVGLHLPADLLRHGRRGHRACCRGIRLQAPLRAQGATKGRVDCESKARLLAYSRQR
eukprot:scaffold53_cov193-Pinguiococcus_pyrenoidosus.AAC.59